MNKHTPARLLPSYRKLLKELEEKKQYIAHMKNDLRTILSEDGTPNEKLLTSERWKMNFRFEEDLERMVWAGNPTIITGKNSTHMRFPPMEAAGPTVRVIVIPNGDKAKEVNKYGITMPVIPFKSISYKEMSEYRRAQAAWKQEEKSLKTFDIHSAMYKGKECLMENGRLKIEGSSIPNGGVSYLAIDIGYIGYAEILPNGKIKLL